MALKRRFQVGTRIRRSERRGVPAIRTNRAAGVQIAQPIRDLERGAVLERDGSLALAVPVPHVIGLVQPRLDLQGLHDRVDQGLGRHGLMAVRLEREDVAGLVPDHHGRTPVEHDHVIAVLADLVHGARGTRGGVGAALDLGLAGHEVGREVAMGLAGRHLVSSFL